MKQEQTIQEELIVVKEQARKCFEKSRDSNQMDAAATFLAQVERILIQRIWYETLMSEINRTDPLPNPEEIYWPAKQTIAGTDDDDVAPKSKTRWVVLTEPKID